MALAFAAAEKKKRVPQADALAAWLTCLAGGRRRACACAVVAAHCRAGLHCDTPPLSLRVVLIVVRPSRPSHHSGRSPNFPGVPTHYSNTHAPTSTSTPTPHSTTPNPPPTTMSLEDGTEFLFTSESVNEGHPGTYS